MSGDKTNGGARYRSRINIDDPNEVTYWMQKLDVPREHLAAAVRKVGASTAAVAKELGKAL